MKIIVHRKSLIYGMADKLADARRYIASISNKLEEHILKCVIYENSTNDYNKWIHSEIVPWLYSASDLRVKTRSGRLSKTDYEKYLFQAFGEDEHDVGNHVARFYNAYIKSGKYPDFVMHWWLIKAATYAESTVSDEFSTMFASSKAVANAQIEETLRDILKRAISIKDN